MATGYEKAFSVTEMTAAINALPFKPFLIGSLGLFEERGLITDTAKIEQLNGTLSIVSTTQRGAPGEVVVRDKRTEKLFSVPHIPAVGSLLADELNGVREFGSENQPASVATARDGLLAKMRQNLELTIEAHRIGAIKGLILDKDGSTLSNLFTDFGVSQQTTGMALTTAGTEVYEKVIDAIVKQDDALGGIAPGQRIALCGITFWQKLRTHANVTKFLLNTPAANNLGTADPTLTFTFAGVTWIYCRGIAGVTIGDDDAYLIPRGVPGLFITRYAPANYNETVNTVGLPMYAESQPLEFGKGYKFEAQTNPLNLCTRPAAIVKLTKV